VYSITIPQTAFTGSNSYANVVAGTSAAQAQAQSAINGFPVQFC